MGEIIQQQDTRRAFVDTLSDLAKNDQSIIVLIPDVGFNYLSDDLPFRIINTGVTEQSTMIIAAALALSGFKPYVYSMINFVVFRPYEMVRNAVSCHDANVKIIGVKGSEKYKFLGFSHNLLDEDEDKRVMKHLMPCCFPTTNEEVVDVIKRSYEIKGPVYIRL